jgi:hypothetical protein
LGEVRSTREVGERGNFQEREVLREVRERSGGGMGRSAAVMPGRFRLFRVTVVLAWGIIFFSCRIGRS